MKVYFERNGKHIIGTRFLVYSHLDEDDDIVCKRINNPRGNCKIVSEWYLEMELMELGLVEV